MKKASLERGYIGLGLLCLTAFRMYGSIPLAVIGIFCFLMSGEYTR